ncbi:tetratricopeptide repeat protein 33-like [Littorina saxatilis]|uniref:Tetratricopeptide repeat protein 33 n=1 Tax=Littorina saxatilis TaxID=31220 RepID=A0AAN9B7U0_9CAEN
MTTFGWKRKAGSGVVRNASQAFEQESKDEDLDNEVTRGEVDWLTLAPKKRMISLEDAKAKSERLREEGSILAHAERYWEAIKKWDEALLLTPSDSKMLEMKAQALMSVGEVFPAVQTAQQAVKADPTWWEARQTLGRAQLNLGEVKMAVRSFSKAVMLNPADKELWEDDLFWACSVRDRMTTVKSTDIATTSKPSSVSVSVVADSVSSDSEEEAASKSSGSVVLRTSVSAGEDQVERDAEETKKVLRVPPNYVHLRG